MVSQVLAEPPCDHRSGVLLSVQKHLELSVFYEVALRMGLGEGVTN